MSFLNKKILSNLTKLAIEAAQEAGEFIEKANRNELVVQHKDSGENLASQVVTQIDKQAQDIILSKLEASIKEFSFGLLTEELPDDQSRFSSDFFWCIDPLDGTLSFINNEPGYSVSIALVSKNGSSVIGVVYDPQSKKTYHAFSEGGCFIDNKKLDNRPQAKFTWVYDRNFEKHVDFKKFEKNLHIVSGDLNCSTTQTRSRAGAVLSACWVLENSPACYFKPAKESVGGGSVWDFAATQCLFQEFNSPCTDTLGKPLDLNPKSWTYMNKKGVFFFTDDKIKKALTCI